MTTKKDKEILILIVLQFVKTRIINEILLQKLPNLFIESLFIHFWDNGILTSEIACHKASNLQDKLRLALNSQKEGFSLKNISFLHFIIAKKYININNTFEIGTHCLKFSHNGKTVYTHHSFPLEQTLDRDSLFCSLTQKLETCQYAWINKTIKKEMAQPFSFLFKVESQETITLFRNSEERKKLQKQELKESQQLCANWISNNITPEGFFNYKVDPTKGKAFRNNSTIVRQLMASRTLAEISSNNPKLIALHKKNLNYILKNWYTETQNKGFVSFQGLSALGANAALLRTFVYSPFFKKLENSSKRIFQTIIACQKENGKLLPYFNPPSNNYQTKEHEYYFSGEAILSLIELYLKVRNKQILDHAILSQDFYINEYVNSIEKNYHPAYPPWHIICLSLLFQITKNKKYVLPLFTLSNKNLELQNQLAYPTDTIGSFFRPENYSYGPQHASADGINTESLAETVRIARITKHPKLAEYERSLKLALQHLKALQITNRNNYYSPDPLLSNGGIKTAPTNPMIRIDNTQHAYDAFQRAISLY